MIANLTVYNNHNELVPLLNDIGFTCLVDAVHNYKSFFLQNYKDVPHRSFFYKPFLIGSVEDIDFRMMGPPDFIIWFNTKVDNNDVRWKDVVQYIQHCLHTPKGYIEITTVTNAKAFLGTHVVPPCIMQSPITEQGDDGLVVVRDADKHFYGFNSKLYEAQDIAVFSVTKPFVEDPFTIILKDFKEQGATHFFADLFACEEWGTNFCDVQFLKQLWEELAIEGDFDIDGLLASRTAQFYPIEGSSKVEPTVLRKSIEDVEKYII